MFYVYICVVKVTGEYSKVLVPTCQSNPGAGGSIVYTEKFIIIRDTHYFLC